MDSKTRAKLRSLAMVMQPTTQIGKNGIVDTLITQIDQQLEAKELVKITVLKNSDLDPKDVAVEIAKLTKSEVVQVVGLKITLYRLSNKDKVKHIL